VIEPLGAKPPESVAVSWTAPPRVTFPEALVESVGVARETIEVSPASPQAPAAAVLVASPEYSAGLAILRVAALVPLLGFFVGLAAVIFGLGLIGAAIGAARNPPPAEPAAQTPGS
jgi:hypothetical protein